MPRLTLPPPPRPKWARKLSRDLVLIGLLAAATAAVWWWFYFGR